MYPQRTEQPCIKLADRQHTQHIENLHENYFTRFDYVNRFDVELRQHFSEEI